MTGISIGWWKRNHNVHHIACNSLDHDPDLQHIPMFAVSAKLFKSLTSVYYERRMDFDQFARFFVSYQHWTFYPVMCVARVNLFAQSVLLLVSNKQVPNRSVELNYFSINLVVEILHCSSSQIIKTSICCCLVLKNIKNKVTEINLKKETKNVQLQDQQYKSQFY